MILIFISIGLALAYAMLILLYRRMWDLGHSFEQCREIETEVRISVIVPCRNEAKNIEACIRALLKQDYPAELLEIIVLDDHSTDQTANIAQTFSDRGVRLLRLSDAVPHTQGKKAAISHGVAISTGTVIPHSPWVFAIGKFTAGFAPAATSKNCPSFGVAALTCKT